MAIGYDSRSDFVIEMLDGNDRDNRCLDSVMFSNESTFNLSGYVNKQNDLILGAEKPHARTEFQWGMWINVQWGDRSFFFCGNCHCKLLFGYS
jgi:hypothetical protein